MKLYTFNQWCAINEGVVCSQEEIKFAEEALERCKNMLAKAIDFWKGWIGDPITKRKFKAAYGYSDNKIEGIFKKYYEAFDKIQLMPYGRCTDATSAGHQYSFPDELDATLPQRTWAFVIDKKFPEHQYKIYINIPDLGKASDEFIEGTLVHEVQHVIYNLVHPLNPQIKLEKCFTTKDNRNPGPIKKFFSKIFGGWKGKDSKIKLSLDTEGGKKIIMETFALDEASADKVVNFLFDVAFERSQYAAKNTENFSRVMGIRNRLGLKPGQDITVEHIKPTIGRIISLQDEPNSFDWEIIYILVNWLQQGAKVSIVDLLNSLNQLAYGNTQDGAVKTV